MPQPCNATAPTVVVCLGRDGAGMRFRTPSTQCEELHRRRIDVLPCLTPCLSRCCSNQEVGAVRTRSARRDSLEALAARIADPGRVPSLLVSPRSDGWAGADHDAG